MVIPGYSSGLDSLVASLINKRSCLEKAAKDRPEMVSTDYMVFETHGLSPSFNKINEQSYLETLFEVKEKVGIDVLVSDLRELGEYKNLGKLDEFLQKINLESSNLSIFDKKSKEIANFVNFSEDIRKFYITDSRITFFSGIIFYFNKEDKKFYDYNKLQDEDKKFGEIVLSEISEQEYKLLKR